MHLLVIIPSWFTNKTRLFWQHSWVTKSDSPFCGRDSGNYSIKLKLIPYNFHTSSKLHPSEWIPYTPGTPTYSNPARNNTYHVWKKTFGIIRNRSQSIFPQVGPALPAILLVGFKKPLTLARDILTVRLFLEAKNAKVHLLKHKCQVVTQLPWELSTAPGGSTTVQQNQTWRRFFLTQSGWMAPYLLSILVSSPRKLTWQWTIHHLKMHFLLKIGIFQCHVSFQGCSYSFKKKQPNRKSIFFVWAMVQDHKRKLEFHAFHWEETTYSSAVLLPWSMLVATCRDTSSTGRKGSRLGPRRMLMAPLQSTMEKPRPSCNRKGW